MGRPKPYPYVRSASASASTAVHSPTRLVIISSLLPFAEPDSFQPSFPFSRLAERFLRPSHAVTHARDPFLLYNRFHLVFPSRR